MPKIIKAENKNINLKRKQYRKLKRQNLVQNIKQLKKIKLMLIKMLMLKYKKPKMQKSNNNNKMILMISFVFKIIEAKNIIRTRII